MFFHFNQNNSGGFFEDNEAVCADVIIEADSPSDANRRAEDVGIYFNGCAGGRDCECCGDRWYEQWYDEGGTENPTIYGRSVYELTQGLFREKCYIYRKDGSKEVVVFPAN